MNWIDAPVPPDVPTFTASPGPKVPLPSTVFEAAAIFITDELLDLIVTETNRYADQNIEAPSASSRKKDWKPLSREELLRFIAITVLMGISPKPTIADYWSTNLLFHNRYQLILRFRHFSDLTYYYK